MCGVPLQSETNFGCFSGDFSIHVLICVSCSLSLSLSLSVWLHVCLLLPIFSLLLWLSLYSLLFANNDAYNVVEGPLSHNAWKMHEFKAKSAKKENVKFYAAWKIHKQELTRPVDFPRYQRRNTSLPTKIELFKNIIINCVNDCR